MFLEECGMLEQLHLLRSQLCMCVLDMLIAVAMFYSSLDQVQVFITYYVVGTLCIIELSLWCKSKAPMVVHLLKAQLALMLLTILLR